jgi:hypothetical protein
MAYIDVDIDDVLYSMSARELQNLVDDLYEDGYIPKKLEKQEERKAPSIPEQFYLEAIDKLARNYHQLTSEEEQTIINLAKRF